MRTIYQPAGRAREYSPRALNIYNGCDHDCSYCYSRKWKTDWPIVEPRRDLVRNLSNFLELHPIYEQVLLCFSGDPYCMEDVELAITRKILEVLLAHKVPVAILTKGGSRCLRDLDLFKKFGPNIKVGATLTFNDPAIGVKYEPGAARVADRLIALSQLHREGIRTWVSFEPVIDPVETLTLMKSVLPIVDEVKIGKVNHMPEVEKAINWSNFLMKALQIFGTDGPDVYVKRDLRDAAPGVVLSQAQQDPNATNLTWRNA